MPHRFLFTAGALLAIAVVVNLRAQPSAHSQGHHPHGFQGYWMGIDPVDGGDARRSLVQLENGRFSLAARDSFFSLCDGTDRGFGSFDDGVVSRHNVLESNNLTLQCFDNGAVVVLRTRFELIGDGIMAETATLQDGTPVSTIIFHRVSSR
jgi:hypothetical protein